MMEAAPYALGSLAPAGYDGYLDEASGEVFAYAASTGECVYGVGADGDVGAVDYRSVMWAPVEGEQNHQKSLVRRKKPTDELLLVVPLRKETAATLIQSLARRRQGWAAAAAKALEQYVKRWDPDSGYYYYEHVLTGTTQWHRPAVLQGTRPRRGLLPAVEDPRYVSSATDEDDYWEAKWEEDPPNKVHPWLKGPYAARLGRGKVPKFRINALPANSVEPRHKPFIDRDLPLCLDHDDVEPLKWKFGDEVQIFDGRKVKRVPVEPYMLARGAATKGPSAIIQLMQRHKRNIEVVYLCLQSIAKCDFREDQFGNCTPEAKACILQTLKVFHRNTHKPYIVAASLQALVQLADNYSGCKVVAAEEWAHLVVKAINNLDMETREVVKRHSGREERDDDAVLGGLDGDNSSGPSVIRTPTAQACEIAASGCRLFAAMACDPQLREKYAQDAIECCVVAMRDCDDDPTVQASACLCLYNFVYRCEFASIVAEKANAAELVDLAIENFVTDYNFMAIAERTRLALLPGGWRGVGAT